MFAAFMEKEIKMRTIDADALKNLAEEVACCKLIDLDVLKIMIDNAPTIDALPKWIPCEERLPELDEICLVTEKDGSIRHCYFDSADPVLFATVEEGMYVRNVIAWIPLPEPYIERSK